MFILKFILNVILYIPRKIYRGLRAIAMIIIATPRMIWKAPVRTYNRAIIWRDWLITKVEYLQSESAKWKTTFNIIKSPYSFLRMMGFSPQMAVGLLAVGSTAGTGVVVSETLFAERSFERSDPGII